MYGFAAGSASASPGGRRVLSWKQRGIRTLAAAFAARSLGVNNRRSALLASKEKESRYLDAFLHGPSGR